MSKKPRILWWIIIFDMNMVITWGYSLFSNTPKCFWCIKDGDLKQQLRSKTENASFSLNLDVETHEILDFLEGSSCLTSLSFWKPSAGQIARARWCLSTPSFTVWQRRRSWCPTQTRGPTETGWSGVTPDFTLCYAITQLWKIALFFIGKSS